MAVYTHFGGMPALVDAVAEEGFRRLAENLAQVPKTDDPLADLIGLAMAYRHTALQNPNLYGVMFGLTAPGGRRIEGDDLTTEQRPAKDSAGYHAFEQLIEGATRAIDAGRFTAVEPFAAAG